MGGGGKNNLRGPIFGRLIFARVEKGIFLRVLFRVFGRFYSFLHILCIFMHFLLVCLGFEVWRDFVSFNFLKKVRFANFTKSLNGNIRGEDG